MESYLWTFDWLPGETDWLLHHLERPARDHPRLVPFTFERHECDALEITMHRCKNVPRRDAFVEHDSQAQPVRQRRNDCPA